MQFHVTFFVRPEGKFGVPEQGTTVLPGTNLGSFSGPTLDRYTGKHVGYGALSRYREDHEALNLQVSVRGSRTKFIDNYAFVDLEAAEAHEAFAEAQLAIGILLQALTVEQSTLFTAQAVCMTDENGSNVPLPLAIPMGKFAVYSTNALANTIRAAEAAVQVTDDRLSRALAYFGVAQQAWAPVADSIEVGAFVRTNAASTAILNYWKACTAVLGDPARAKDGYQRRYSELGLDQEFKARLDALKALRDDSDVAHYTLSPNAGLALQERVPASSATARQAIRAYTAKLQRATTEEGESDASIEA